MRLSTVVSGRSWLFSICALSLISSVALCEEAPAQSTAEADTQNQGGAASTKAKEKTSKAQRAKKEDPVDEALEEGKASDDQPTKKKDTENGESSVESQGVGEKSTRAEPVDEASTLVAPSAEVPGQETPDQAPSSEEMSNGQQPAAPDLTEGAVIEQSPSEASAQDALAEDPSVDSASMEEQSMRQEPSAAQPKEPTSDAEPTGDAASVDGQPIEPTSDSQPTGDAPSVDGQPMDSAPAAEESMEFTPADSEQTDSPLPDDRSADSAPTDEQPMEFAPSDDQPVEAESTDEFSFDTRDATLEEPEDELSRAVLLSERGEFAEAATVFDQEFDRIQDLSILLRAALAWYQGAFYSAAVERFALWKTRADAVDPKQNPALVQQKAAVEALYAKAVAQVFRVTVMLPEDAYRKRSTPVTVQVSRLSDGFAPPSRSWVLSHDPAKRAHLIDLEPGRWLFEVQSSIYQEEPEVVEIYDDSPLTLSPLPSMQMPAKDAPTDERIAYREALDQFRVGAYAAAVKSIYELVPNGLVSEEALWLEGQASERAEMWHHARQTYVKLLERHPKSLAAAEIQTKLEDLARKAEKTKASIRFTTTPEDGVVTLKQDGEMLKMVGDNTVFPGRYEVEVIWSTGVRKTQTIQVNPIEPQTFALSSVDAIEALAAEKWSLRGQMGTGLALVSGNQSTTVDLMPGITLSTGLEVGWQWLERFRFEIGLNYAQTRPGFEATNPTQVGTVSGVWVFHHLNVPVSGVRTSAFKTEFSGGLSIDALLSAEELGDENVNITQTSRQINASLNMRASHPFTLLSRDFGVHLFVARQLMSLTSESSTLRLQQVGLGLSTRML